MSGKIEERLKQWMRDIPILSPWIYKFYNAIPLPLRVCKRYFRVMELMERIEDNHDVISIIQKELLAETLQNALSFVPHYKKLVKIDPRDIKPENSFAVLKEFPFIEKDEIMRHPQGFISINIDKSKLQYLTTGGTTGTGIGLWRTTDELHVERAFIDYMWGKYGYSRGSKVLRMGCDAIVPLEQFPCKVRGNRLLVSPHHLNEKWFKPIIETIEKFKPEFIHAYPSCVELLAGFLREKGLQIKIKGIFLASEEIIPGQIELSNEVFGVPICFFYGASEHVLLAYGCYDGKNVTYHFNPLYGIAENLQDEFGNYELVGTSLWNHAMPFVRYRTTDYGKISKEQVRCKKCGKSWKTVIRLDGRKQDFLVTKHGTLYPGFSYDLDKSIWDYIKTFGVVQDKPGELELHIVPRNNFNEEVEKIILEDEKRRLGDWFDIKLVKVNEILRTKGGKRRAVIVNHDVTKAVNC